MLSVSGIVYAIGNFYGWLIIAYVIMTWIPQGNSVVEDIRRVLATVVEPYIMLFRRIIPPIGMVDISPIVALFVLRLLIVPLLTRLTAGL